MDIYHVICEISRDPYVTRAGVYGKEFQYYYTKPYFRFIPYLVGIFGGWLYHKYAKRMEQLAKMKPVSWEIVTPYCHVTCYVSG